MFTDSYGVRTLDGNPEVALHVQLMFGSDLEVEVAIRDAR